MANAALNPAMAAVLAASMAQSVGVGGALTKMARELYIGNLPGGVSIQQLTDFLNAAMKQLGVCSSPQGTVVGCWISTDGHYAFVEFRTVVS